MRLASETANAEAASTAESAAAEAAGTHASPASTTFCPRRPATGATESTGVPAHAAKGRRFSACIVVLRPGVRSGGAIGVKILRALLIHVDRIFVVCVSAVVVVVAVSGVVIGVVVAVGIVVAAVVISPVPGGISVVSSAVINDSGAMPAAVPTAVSPATTSAAHHGSD